LRSLAVKLTLAFLVVSVVGVALIALILQQRTQSEVGQLVTDQLRAELVNNLTEYYERTGSWAEIDGIFMRTRHWDRSRNAAPAPVTLLDKNRAVVFSGAGFVPGEKPLAIDGVEAPIVVDDETVGWVAFDPARFSRLPPPGSPESDFLGRINTAILVSALGAVALAIIMGVWLARTIASPLHELTEATQALAQGQLGRQVAVRSQDEIGALAASFNRMSVDLARANQLRRQMTADVAHDLRTPLSVLLGYAEALDERMLQGSPDIYAVMHSEARHLNRLIDDLRTLSLADADELPLHMQPVDPQALLARTAAAHKIQADERHVTLRVEAPSLLPEVMVDEERMIQVLGNLVSNALRYTPAGGSVTLSASADQSRVSLSVQDTGAGIAPADLPFIFERFYRGDKARSSDGESGLGLAIAKSIVEMHGGVISAVSTPGEGSTFTVELLRVRG
jgi:signal transduction histidine kinase